MNFTINEMTEKDRDAVTSFMRVFYASDAVSTNGSEEIFQNNFNACVGSSPYAEGYVFKNDDKRLGYAILAKAYNTEFGKKCIWIEDLYLSPEARGLGVGKAFLAFVREKYPDAVLRLEVESENERAVALYKKCGYEELPYMEMIKLL